MKSSLIGSILLLTVIAVCSTASEQTRTLYITPTAVGSMRIPVGTSAEEWGCFPTAGISFELPVTLPQFSCFMTLEAGDLVRKHQSFTAQMFRIDFGLKLHTLYARNDYGIAPVVGLSSLMVDVGGGDIDIFSLHMFGEVENEYGFFAGIIPWYRWRSLEVSLPVYGERILSSPQQFSTVVIALRLGYRVTR